MCGDIHGELKTLVWEVTEKYKISDANILILGDFGIGFSGKGESELKGMYDTVSKRLEKKNITLWAIRGNHDDPSFFPSHAHPRLKLLADHVIQEISGFQVYPIGGGVSEDRAWRLKKIEELEKKRSRQRVWWEGERVDKRERHELPVKVDIIVSHMAPTYFPPVPVRLDTTDYDLWNEVLEDRKYLDSVTQEVNAEYWFYGHYHAHYSGELGKLLYRGLGIRELYEVSRRNP